LLPFIQTIRVYITTNLPSAFVTGFVMLFIWLLANVWNGNSDKLADIASTSASTAKSMQELVVFVKEDRVEITNLKRRVNALEDWKAKHDEDVKDYWKNYYYNPNKAAK
jgi:hypothetical protein